MDLSTKPCFTGDRAGELAWIATSRNEMAAFMLRALGPAGLPLVDAIISANDLAELRREAQKCAWILSKKTGPGHHEAFRATFSAVIA
jgi:hypothetical protein